MELFYENEEITFYKFDVRYDGGWEDFEKTIDFCYEADDTEVIDFLFELITSKNEMTEEEQDALEVDLENNLEKYADKYYKELLIEFEEEACQWASDKGYQYFYDLGYDSYWEDREYD